MLFHSDAWASFVAVKTKGVPREAGGLVGWVVGGGGGCVGARWCVSVEWVVGGGCVAVRRLATTPRVEP